jgi:hypothetical protein
VALVLLQRIAPIPRVPWRPAPSIGRFVRHNVGWVLFAPALVLAGVADLLLTPLLRRPRWSNTYRVIARKL